MNIDSNETSCRKPRLRFCTPVLWFVPGSVRGDADRHAKFLGAPIPSLLRCERWCFARAGDAQNRAVEDHLPRLGLRRTLGNRRRPGRRRTPEIISAENLNEGDVHYTSAVVAQQLGGKILWTWGEPDVGRKKWHHDVACQIYDWDGDGRQEVVVCEKASLVELDGPTGKEKRRFPIPEDATD